jgi:hypothetical protein
MSECPVIALPLCPRASTRPHEGVPPQLIDPGARPAPRPTRVRAFLGAKTASPTASGSARAPGETGGERHSGEPTARARAYSPPERGVAGQYDSPVRQGLTAEDHPPAPSRPQPLSSARRWGVSEGWGEDGQTGAVLH